MAVYDRIGQTYSRTRTADHRIARQITTAVGPARRDTVAPNAVELRELLAVERFEVMPVPADCTDGFGCAYWNRPEAHLDPDVLAGMSWSTLLDSDVVRAGVDRLRSDLATGAWDRRHGELRALDEMDLGYRLAVAGPG